MNKTEMHLTE